MASAGTIFDENTSYSKPATNITSATESVCPKGWTLPSNAQTSSIAPHGSGSDTYIPMFSPIGGGRYQNGVMYEENRGYWWTSEPSTAPAYLRLYLLYRDNIIKTANDASRSIGTYIRCVQKST